MSRPQGHRPQLPGKVTIKLEAHGGSIDIDGYDIGQFTTSMRLMYDAKNAKPVLLLDLLPTVVDVQAEHVELRGDFRDFLLAHGWQPPA